ncbi:putative isoflavone reductase family protein [Rosellinia necatrix]|uniref:Putative isoflavone reductase family protein n=1 Tax=Rosellinia necatrix TaxID=77044 RepID=A0A1W2TRV6_ROSNE|nr:putative isoflavone reductase family protein [Rosellinia necatrix]
MSALPFSVLILGATGVIGEHITDAILSAKAASGHSISIFTSDATAHGQQHHKAALVSSWKSRGLRVITGDIKNDQDVSRAYEGVDVVVSCLGRNVLAGQTGLIKLAEESASVKWFFPSEYGTDIEYDASSRDEKPHQNKLRVRQFIRDHIGRVQCTHLVTGPYIEMYLTLMSGAKALGGYDVEHRTAEVIGSGNEAVGFTSMPDVGKLVVAALRHPDEAMGKVLKVQSFVTTPLAIVREFEKATGAEWVVNHTSNQALRELEARLWDEDNPLATAATLRRIWAEGGTLYEQTDNAKLGLGSEDMETLGEVVGRAVKKATSTK